MAKIIANSQPGGAVAVKIYNKEGEANEIVIGSKLDSIETLKIEAIRVLKENGSEYNKKYAKQLEKAISR